MHDSVKRIITDVSGVLLGKEKEIKLALACLMARGHLLIEDLPGMGKTTLAHALAIALGLEYRRVQFTSDLLPSDIIGYSRFDKDANNFEFQKGPLFTQILLADEINRSSPKTQSALLEAMEEKQVTFEGVTRKLPEPFFVIATQNPFHQSGTYPLPESQLDRFLMCIGIGFPDKKTERELFKGINPREQMQRIVTICNTADLQQMQKIVHDITVSEALLDYLQRLVAFTRESGHFLWGLSPRGALALLEAAKSWAFIENRKYVAPEDVQAVFVAVTNHRLRYQTRESMNSADIGRIILEQVDIIA